MCTKTSIFFLNRVSVNYYNAILVSQIRFQHTSVYETILVVTTRILTFYLFKKLSIYKSNIIKSNLFSKYSFLF